MKSIFKIFLALIILGIVTITGVLLIKYYGKLEVPELKSNIIEYGNVTNKNESSVLYEIRAISFTSENEFVNTSIKEFLDKKINEFKEDNNTTERIRDKDRALLLQSLDSYLVNDGLISIKITSMIKKTHTQNAKGESCCCC